MKLNLNEFRQGQYYLDKSKTQMTKGLAIICMVVLHLFCRKGSSVDGTPLLWINEEVPFVYIFGFLAEICVPLYSMCSGYAHYVMGTQGKLTSKLNANRILKFLLNYWVVVIVFSLIGMFVVGQNDIPVSFAKFLKTMLLLDSYNGAWWYVATYVILCLFSNVLYNLVKKTNALLLTCFAVVQYIAVYLIQRTGFTPRTGLFIADFAITQVMNFFGKVFLCYIVGMLFVKLDVFSMLKLIGKKMNIKQNVRVLFIIAVTIGFSAIVFILEKGIIMPFYAMYIFVIFNYINISGNIKNAFMYFGKHSTNIWLVHMFFYSVLFKDLVFVVEYPVFVFAFMILLCLLCSYVINFIYFKALKVLKLQKVK